MIPSIFPSKDREGPYVFQGPSHPPAWRRAAKNALLAFAALAEGANSSVKEGRQITILISKDRSSATVQIGPMETATTLKPSFANALVHPYPFYSEKDRFNVKELLTALDEASVWSLGIKMFHFAEIGDRISHLHPMTFMKIVFTDPILREKLYRIFQSPLKRIGMMNGSVFREGFRHQLDREMGKGALESHIEPFAKTLNVNKEEIRRLIQLREWTDLYFYLLENTPAQEARRFQG